MARLARFAGVMSGVVAAAAAAQAKDPQAGPKVGAAAERDIDVDALLDRDLEEILRVQIAEATERPTDVADTPASVLVFEAERLERLGVRDAARIFLLDPSTLVYRGNGSNTQVAIRGMARSGSGGGTSFQLDGMPVNVEVDGSALALLAGLSTHDLDRIEVIRGPASVLYGTDSFHGTVRFNTWRAPAPMVEGLVDGGSHGYLHGTARGHFELAENTTATAIVGWTSTSGVNLSVARTSESAEKEATRDVHERSLDAQIAVIKAGYQDPCRHLRAGVYALRSQGTGWPNVGMSGLPPNGQESFERDFYGAQVRAEHCMPAGVQLTAQAYALHTPDVAHFGVAEGPPGTADLTKNTASSRWGGHARVSQDLQAIDAEWVARVSYDHYATTKDTFSLNHPSGGVATQAQGASRDVLGLSLHTTTDRVPLTRLVAGARADYTSDMKRWQVSPRLAAVFRPVPEWTLKVVFGRGFRSPLLLEMIPLGFGDHELGSASNLRAEILDAVELLAGLKMGGASFELGAYYSSLRNGIYFAKTGEHSDMFGNGTEAVGRGVEGGAKLRLGPVLLRATAAWQKSEQRVPERVSYEAFPAWSVCTEAVYAFAPLGLRLSVAFVTRGGWTGDAAAEAPRLPAMALLIGDALWRPKAWGQAWAVGLAVHNALNTAYRTPSLLRLLRGVREPGRTLTASLRYTWPG